jgi:hypothetical protein
MTHSTPDLPDWKYLTDDEGLLDRPMAVSRLWVPPNIELLGNRLLWGNRAKDPWVEDMWLQDDRRRVPSPDLLTRFVSLADSNAAAILEFARRNGPLQLCRHRLTSGCYQPRTHQQERGKDWCKPLSRKRPGQPSRFYEPLESWWIYARIARSILNVAANLVEGQPGRAEDWVLVLKLFEGDGVPTLRTDPGGVKPHIRRSILALAVNIWIRKGSLRVRVSSWETLGRTHHPTMHLSSGTLFGELGLRLAMRVCGTSGLATCSACGTPYTPKRVPTPGKRSFCPKCGRREAQKAAAADYRRRKKEHRDG